MGVIVTGVVDVVRAELGARLTNLQNVLPI